MNPTMSDDVWQNPPPAGSRAGCLTWAFGIVATIAFGLLVTLYVANLADHRQNAAKLADHFRKIGLSKWIDEGRLVVTPRPMLHFASDLTYATLTVPPNETDDLKKTIIQVGYFTVATSQPATAKAPRVDESTMYFLNNAQDVIDIYPTGEVRITADTFHYR